jgi:hypothetical protein
MAWGGATMPGWRGASRSFFSKMSFARLLSASSYSFVMVRARVGQASMQSPQKMQRR